MKTSTRRISCTGWLSGYRSLCCATLSAALLLVWLLAPTPSLTASTSFRVQAALDCPYNTTFAVAVLTDGEQLGRIGSAIARTWLSSACHPMLFFVGTSHAVPADLPAELQARIVTLPCIDDYPPLQKELLMWQWMHRHVEPDLEWLVKADADTYINLPQLAAILQEATRKQDRYVGNAVQGRSSESIEALGIYGAFCQGLGYGVHRSVLQAVGPNMDQCYEDRMRENYHSDTEMSRCIFRYTNITCSSYGNSFRNIAASIDEHGILSKRLMTGSNQMVVAMSKAPPENYFQSAVLHPIKTADSLYYFHQLVVGTLRPLQPPIVGYADGVDYSVYKSAIWAQRASCTHNAPRQYEKFRMKLKTCPSSANSSVPSLSATPLYTLNELTNGTTVLPISYLAALKQDSFAHGLQVNEGLKAILRKTLSAQPSQPRLAVMSSDASSTVSPQTHTEQHFDKMLHAERCGRLLFSPDHASIILLSCSGTRSDPEQASCDDITSGTIVPATSVNALFHHRTYARVLELVDSVGWGLSLLLTLVDEGYTVRCMVPPA